MAAVPPPKVIKYTGIKACEETYAALMQVETFRWVVGLSDKNVYGYTDFARLARSLHHLHTGVCDALADAGVTMIVPPGELKRVAISPSMKRIPFSRPYLPPLLSTEQTVMATTLLTAHRYMDMASEFYLNHMREMDAMIKANLPRTIFGGLMVRGELLWSYAFDRFLVDVRSPTSEAALSTTPTTTAPLSSPPLADET